ncbi:MAG: hypothetical protein WKG06_09260 [Segetibacter sp.]
MKDYFIGKFNNNTVEFEREFINEKDIWYSLSLGVEGKKLKYRMHNNKNSARTWKIMGNRVPFKLLQMEEDFNDVIGKNEGLFIKQ